MEKLKARNNNLCELCNLNEPTIAFTVSPKSDEDINHQVSLCDTCHSKLNHENESHYWRCLEGSIWSETPAVKALSYRLLQNFKNEDWANNTLSSVDVEEEIVNWAMSAFEIAAVHKDAFGNILENGDNVVLTQALDVKGTNFTASKGTVVKRIKLVSENAEHIEGKINEQSIVILTKYVKKQ
ncbi:MAG: PhnA domain-containing protein [Sphingobacteriaceae bacterium]|nr:PhnA domain-containing protein [Sphingobacteriaceae bacterium]